jgi:DNA-binding MarR family transcriptional regulator
MQQLWAVAHALQRVSKHMASNIGLTGPQRMALLMVGRRPGITAGELAAVLHLHPATLTGILDRLTRARLIKYERDAADARRLRLTLTPRGRAANRRRVATVESAVRQVVAEASAADVAATARVLTRLAESLHGVIGGPPRRRTLG